MDRDDSNLERLRTELAADQPIRSRTGAFLLMLAIPAAGLAALWALFRLAVYEADYNAAAAFVIMLVGASAVGLAAAHAWRIARRMALPDALTLLRRDRRRPVVFLRAFFTDAREASATPVGKRIGAYDLLEAPPKVKVGLSRRLAADLSLGGAFRRIGPFVAIGRPSETLASMGAARLYVVHERWREAVKLLVHAAAAIVIQPEGTEGTSWEFALIARECDLRRVLMLVPNPRERPLGYERVREVVNAILAKPIPEAPGGCDAFVFDEAGWPTAVTLGRRPAAALRPFLDRIRELERQA